MEKNGEIGMRNAECKRMRKWEGGRGIGKNGEVGMRKRSAKGVEYNVLPQLGVI
jgi:hypothetical protein